MIAPKVVLAKGVYAVRAQKTPAANRVLTSACLPRAPPPTPPVSSLGSPSRSWPPRLPTSYPTLESPAASFPAARPPPSASGRAGEDWQWRRGGRRLVTHERPSVRPGVRAERRGTIASTRRRGSAPSTPTRARRRPAGAKGKGVSRVELDLVAESRACKSAGPSARGVSVPRLTESSLAREPQPDMATMTAAVCHHVPPSNFILCTLTGWSRRDKRLRWDRASRSRAPFSNGNCSSTFDCFDPPTTKAVEQAFRENRQRSYAAFVCCTSRRRSAERAPRRSRAHHRAVAASAGYAPVRRPSVAASPNVFAPVRCRLRRHRFPQVVLALSGCGRRGKGALGVGSRRVTSQAAERSSVQLSSA